MRVSLSHDSDIYLKFFEQGKQRIFLRLTTGRIFPDKPKTVHFQVLTAVLNHTVCYDTPHPINLVVDKKDFYFLFAWTQNVSIGVKLWETGKNIY